MQRPEQVDSEQQAGGRHHPMQAVEATVARPIGQAEEEVRRALSEEGFGVLTEIDVAATLEAKLGVHRSPLKILGACNPSLAHRVLELDPSVALLLPCNVVLEEVGEGSTRVSIADPRDLLASGESGTSGLDQLAAQAAEALERVLGRLAA